MTFMGIFSTRILSYTENQEISLVAMEVLGMTTYGATNENKVGIMTILSFQCSRIQKSHAIDPLISLFPELMNMMTLLY